MVNSHLKTAVTCADKPPVTVLWGEQATPFGPMLIGVTEEGTLCHLEFMGKQKPKAIVKEWARAWPRTVFAENERATAQIARRIFSGKKTDIKIGLVGTPFQQSVWKALLSIPAGKVVSYADIAKRIKKPKAVRAVGTALGANPVPILVPCHRVIASDGTLGGYGGGLAIKKKLLKAESVMISWS